METAFVLNIKDVYEANSFEIPFERFLDDETTTENWPEADYEFAISTNQSGSPKLISLKSTDGQISVSTNNLIVTCLANENTMKGGKIYYYDLVADYGNGLTKVEGNGTIAVKYSIAK